MSNDEYAAAVADVHKAQASLHDAIVHLKKVCGGTSQVQHLVNGVVEPLVALLGVAPVSFPQDAEDSFQRDAVAFLRDNGVVAGFYGGVDVDATLHLIECEVDWAGASRVGDQFVETFTDTFNDSSLRHTLGTRVWCACGKGWVVEMPTSMSLAEIFVAVSAHAQLKKQVPPPPPPRTLVKFGVTLGVGYTEVWQGELEGEGDTAKVVLYDTPAWRQPQGGLSWSALVGRFGLPHQWDSGSDQWVAFPYEPVV